MAAAILSHCAAAATAAVSSTHRSTEMVGTKVASFAGLRSVAFAPKLERSLRDAVTAVPASRRAGALAASMVAAPAVRGADVEFQTEIFNKEKITLAGRDEVNFANCMTCRILNTRMGLYLIIPQPLVHNGLDLKEETPLCAEPLRPDSRLYR